MLPLIDTIIGFAVIMLLLSLLIKSLTSVLKNHVDYYSRNLEMEVKRLINGTIDLGGQTLEAKAPWTKNIQWRRLSEEFLNHENMKWMLTKLGADWNALKNLKARLEVHKSNIRYAFEKRTKNISLLLGLTLCLALNINALSIWDTLYNDQQVRSKFASEEFVKSALDKTEEYFQSKEEASGESTETDKGKQREALKKERQEFMESIYHFKERVNFGIGKIWTEPVGVFGFLYQFFGTLLTGILVSIGAPYWHDLLRTLSAWRKR